MMKTSKTPLILLPTLAVSLAMLACSLPGASPTATVASPATLAPAPTATEVAAPTEEPTAAVTAAVSGDARDELIAAINAAKTAGPYHVVSSLTSPTTSVNEHGDVILPDKFHIFATINTLPEREYLIIGSNTWVGTGGTLTATQVDISSFVDAFINTFDPDKISNVVLVGTEDVNGTPAKHFTFTYTNNISGVDILSNVDMWVGVDNGLPIKQVIAGTANGNPYQAQQDITYDPSITIEAP